MKGNLRQHALYHANTTTILARRNHTPKIHASTNETKIRSPRNHCTEISHSQYSFGHVVQTTCKHILGVVAAISIGCQSPAVAVNLPTMKAEQPVLDLAKIVPSGQLEALSTSISTLESETGWRVRLLTKYDKDVGPSVDDIRAAWKPDKRTVVVTVDTSAPNIFYFNYGDEVLGQLRRPFFTELQARYGNLFYVRENGESAAVVNVLGALVDCLAKEGGCLVVPGLPADQYYLTLTTSIAGGIVAGFASQLEAQGMVKRKWVWVLLFFPLWGTLFINFGIGPIVTRTSDPLPVLGNVAGFLAAAAVVKLSPMFAAQAGLRDNPDNN